MNNFEIRLFKKRSYIKHNKLSNGQPELDLYHIAIDDYYCKYFFSSVDKK